MSRSRAQPHRSSWLAVLALIVTTSACGGTSSTARTSPPEPDGDVASIATWLVGDWVSADTLPAGERWSYEDGVLRGHGFATESEPCAGEPCPTREVTTEAMVIELREGALVYRASPVGQDETAFVITERSDTHFVAEAPEHDFPTRVEYRLAEAPRRLEIHVSGGDRAFDLTLVRR